MFDKVMCEKICSVTCSLEELIEFNRGIDKKEFDCDKAFEKYYNIDSIKKCINLYKEGAVSDRFVACWANAYNWTLMAGFKNEYEEFFTLKEILLYEIADWLDSLSFFETSVDYISAEKYLETFVMLDKLYNNVEEWRFYYLLTNETYLEGDFVNSAILLLVNNKTKEILLMYSDICNFEKMSGNAIRIELAELKKIKEDFLNQGYRLLVLASGAIEDEDLDDLC